MTKSYSCIGIMTGTSMDGVDLAHCTFQKDNEQWQFQINHFDCIPFPEIWQTRLVHLPDQDAETFAKTNIFFGHFLGKCVADFLTKYDLKENTDFVSSHGQTIFHNPRKGYTIQIGHGAALARECNLPVVCDLRTTDMAYGGQGAPIVPYGEKHLFPTVNQFLNIGGISNISIHELGKVIGYDVCMGNLLLDEYAFQKGFDFDEGGRIARSGTVDVGLLKQLNSHEFFNKKAPKSLDADEVLKAFLPICEEFDISIDDKMATLVEHIAAQLQKNLNDKYDVMITGGGGLNQFLVERIQHHFTGKVIIPQRNIIECKEALIIAFLGLQRLLKQVNVLASVTGASKDTINGAVYLP